MEENLNEKETQKGEIELVVHTAARTLFVAVIALAFIISALFSFFPALPRNLYYSLDNYPQALRYARMNAAKLRNGDADEYCAALLDVVTLSEKLYTEKGDKKYASVLYSETFEFHSVSSASDYNRKLDEFNYENSSPTYRAVIYSNESYIRKLNYIGALALEKGDMFLSKEGYKSLSDILGADFVGNYDAAMEFSFLLVQLNESIKAGIMPTAAENERLRTLFSAYKEYSLTFDDSGAVMDDTFLAKLYFVRVAGIFSHTAAERFGTEDWAELNCADLDGQQTELIVYYRDKLLKDYMIQK